MSEDKIGRSFQVEPRLDPPEGPRIPDYWCLGDEHKGDRQCYFQDGIPESDDLGEGPFCPECLKRERPRKCSNCEARRPSVELFCRNCGAAASTVGVVMVMLRAIVEVL